MSQSNLSDDEDSKTVAFGIDMSNYKLETAYTL